MKILFFGKEGCSYSSDALDYLQKLGHDITVFWSKKRNEKIPQEILLWEGDYLFCFYSYAIIPQTLLDRSNIAINFHPASPEHPGSGMINWAIYNKSKEFGATAHLIDDKIDSGKILKVKRFDILGNDDIDSLSKRTKFYCMILFYEIMQHLLIDKKSIDELLQQSKDEKWNGKSRKIKQIDKMSLIDIDIEREELDMRIKSFHTKNFPLSLYLHGRKFIHV